MIKKFLRLFAEHRGLEKSLERSEAFAASLGRYIAALEGRDKERLIRIEELEKELLEARSALQEALGAAANLRRSLNELSPHRKGEL